MEGLATRRRKIEKEMLPAEPPSHMVNVWRGLVMRAMAGQDVSAEAETMRAEERAYWIAQGVMQR